MEPLITIRVDMRNVQQLLQGIPKAMPKVISRSINRTITPVKTYMARQLVGPVNMEMSAIRTNQKKAGRHILGYYKEAPSTRFTIADMKKNIDIQRANLGKWFALLWIRSFKGNEAVESTQPSFVAQMPSGHVSIFKRLGAARNPIADQLRRLMHEYFPGLERSIIKEAEERLKRNVEDQIKLALDQWRTGAGKTA